MRSTLFFLTGVFLLQACVKDKPDSVPEPVISLTPASKKVFVINEGNFGSGNASVSLFDPAKNEVVEDFYKTQNSAALGDVAQSMSRVNDNYYVVVNNSAKILVCDKDFKKTGQISGLTSPRYLLPVSNQKAYVSDLYANAISIIDLNTRTKTGSILCYGKTEQMALVFGKVFVTNTESNYVYIINPSSDKIEDSVLVGKYASGIVADKNDKVWVLSTGDLPNAVGKLSKINPLTNSVDVSFAFSSSEFPGSLCLNKGKDTLFFLNSGICRMAVTASSLPATPLIAKGTRNFYGLAVNPDSYFIYAADALDYSQRSTIYVYDQNGNQKTTFKAGINANGFYFE